MGQLDKLEMVLDEQFKKKAPKIPSDGRKSLAGALWWLALAFGVLQLWLAWDLWQVGHVVNEYLEHANNIARAYGLKPAEPDLGLFYFLSVIVLAVDAVLLLLAAPGLKAMRKAGWNLLFYGLLLNVAYGFVRMFSSHGGGFDDLLFAALGSLVGAYLLFQVRDYFIMSKSTAEKPAHKPAEAAHKEAEKK